MFYYTTIKALEGENEETREALKIPVKRKKQSKQK